MKDFFDDLTEYALKSLPWALIVLGIALVFGVFDGRR